MLETLFLETATQPHLENFPKGQDLTFLSYGFCLHVPLSLVGLWEALGR